MRRNRLEGWLIYLRKLRRADGPTLARWMSDDVVTRYFAKDSGLRGRDGKFWEAFCGDDDDNVKFGICEKTTGEIIGIVGLFSVNWRLSCASTGLVIGVTRLWRTGRAFEAKMLCLEYCFKVLKLKYVYSIVNAKNMSAISHLRRCGYDEFNARRYSNNVCEVSEERVLTFVFRKDDWREMCKRYPLKRIRSL
jgi:RimJ/RimL family protein N-acetyltransferase